MYIVFEEMEPWFVQTERHDFGEDEIYFEKPVIRYRGDIQALMSFQIYNNEVSEMDLKNIQRVEYEDYGSASWYIHCYNRKDLENFAEKYLNPNNIRWAFYGEHLVR